MYKPYGFRALRTDVSQLNLSKPTGKSLLFSCGRAVERNHHNGNSQCAVINCKLKVR